MFYLAAGRCKRSFTCFFKSSVLISCKVVLDFLEQFDWNRFCEDVNDLSHVELLNGLSPAWINSCFFNLPDWLQL